MSVLLGNGNGTFQAKQSFGTGSWPQSVAVADFNGDGKSDLVTADWPERASVLLGNGNGTFQAGNPSARKRASSVAVGDFNGDGKSDLVTADERGLRVSVLLGNGNGTFQAQRSFGTGVLAYSVALADFNGDGKSDLVTADGVTTRRACCSATATGRFRPGSPSARERALLSCCGRLQRRREE